MIEFRCKSCKTPLNADSSEAGERQICPICNASGVVPAASDPDADPIVLVATKISNATYQLVCPKCNGTHNFRESSLGSTTNCRNCGLKIDLPHVIPSGKSGGCLGVLLLLAVGVVEVTKVI